jgi:hypothetical protein
MRSFMTLAFVVPVALVVGFVACSSKAPSDPGGDAGGKPTTSASSSGGGSAASSGGVFNSTGDGATSATDCKGGHYSGSFAGKYTSYLTSLFGLGGIPLDVTGNLDLDLDEQTTMTSGELEQTTYNIANGTISGFADKLFPYHCDMVGTLDCNTKQLVNGGLRNCWYCLGLFDSPDGGNCLIYGHFDGPLTADYDGNTFSFVNGTWNGSEEAALDDAGTLPEGGGVNDAGEYVGPGNYGGAGTWTATYTTDY